MNAPASKSSRPPGRRVPLAGWGRYPVVDAQLFVPRSDAEIAELISGAPSVIARGSGRAYGDSAVNAPATLDMRRFNRMLSFDPSRGLLVAEAGVTLAEIIDTFLPRGWFPLVTPGTKFVTLGGAIAADVHGKNHHREGSFRAAVDWVDVMGPDGTVDRLSASRNPALFDATLGGMGLTGVILRAGVRLRPVETAWIRQTTVPAPDLSAALAALAEDEATYSVAWIDCLATGRALGRSLVMSGEHARRDELPPAQAGAPFAIPRRRNRRVPVDFPGFALNRYSVRAFNSLYWRQGVRRRGTRLVDWDTYFYPLDSILAWNRIYGRRGLAQFQCVLPPETAEAGLTQLLGATSRAGSASFLAVLKRFGRQESAFSFPMEGFTLAMDFPVSPATLTLLEQLDRIVLDHGGRFYLAKDSRMSAATLRASDQRVPAFCAFRAAGNMKERFRSAQAERLEL